MSSDLQLHHVGGRRPGTAEPLPRPLADLQAAQRLTAGGLARCAAGLLKSCPEASFHIQQTFDSLTCDGRAECQTTVKMSSHGGEDFMLCLERRRLRGNFLSQGLSKIDFYPERPEAPTRVCKFKSLSDPSVEFDASGSSQ